MLPFTSLEALARDSERMQQTMHRLLAGEIARERTIMLMLGTMRAEQRVAAFLLDLARRYRERGYSSTEFVLRMTREEIGSYLGLKLETVSRLFSHLHREGLVQVQGRVVKLLDLSAPSGGSSRPACSSRGIPREIAAGVARRAGRGRRNRLRFRPRPPRRVLCGGGYVSAEQSDRQDIRDLIENWALWRDAGDWARFRSVWHDDGVMMATWFQGPAAEFIRVTRKGWAKGVSASSTSSAARRST